VSIRQNSANEISLDTAEKNTSTTEEQVKEYYVDISGAVKNPGVYKVKSKTRLVFLIDKAGGLTKNADLDAINQASYVEDGAKIIIPKKGENGGTGGETDGASSSTESSGGSTQGKININQASASELTAIPGVGTVIAQRIVEYRNGARFNSIEDIKNVKGIGEATFEKMKGQITV
ncbi:MAG: ComEA family DNA-binding protein, partial [Eubacteriales bacterium]|nr:ComEA family DNA-binding protein [Eubacteriales bacterium]